MMINHAFFLLNPNLLLTLKLYDRLEVLVFELKMNVKKYLYIIVAVIVVLLALAIALCAEFSMTNITSDPYGFIIRFLELWAPAAGAIGTIIVAIVCSLLIALCEMAYVGILAETIDAVKVIDTKGLPTSVVFFDFSLRHNNPPWKQTPDSAPSENISCGWTIYLADTKAALGLVSVIALSILGLFLIKGETCSLYKTFLPTSLSLFSKALGFITSLIRPNGRSGMYV